LFAAYDGCPPSEAFELATLNYQGRPPWHTNLVVKKSRLLRISDLALPIVAGAIATNLMTFVDTLMVGQLGDPALGGVGIGGQLFFLLLAVTLGLAAGVQAMVARRVGEDHLEVTGKVLNAGILLAAFAGLILIALGYLLMPLIFGVINDDPLVVEEGLAYLSTRIPSLLFIGINVAFRSYWIGVSLAKWSMVSIVTLSLANILFNYMLIFGNFGAPRMEVAGAGLGSTLAVSVGLLINLGFAIKFAQKNGFLHGLPQTEQIITMVKISYPESLRQALFSVGVVLMYVLIGQIGTRELAAFHVVINICLIAYMPHIGIGGAATTLVGEALGRKGIRDAKNWGWQVSNVGLIVLTCLGIGIAIFPQALLSLFLVDEGTLALAILPLQLAVFAHVLDGYGKVMGSALIGAGDTTAAMQLTLLPQWLLLLPLLSLSVFMGYGLKEAMGIFFVSTLISALLFAYIWQRERWSRIEL
jgi:MATE family multidrug resistance protein